MKWPGGPLEIATRLKTQTLRAELKEALAAWIEPPALELLKGTPVNCLIVDWADGEPQAVEQQRALRPLIEAGRRLGISFVGQVTSRQDPEAAIAAGLQAGLAGVLLENPPARPNSAPVILRSPRPKVPWDSAFPILSVTENLWPGLGLETMKEKDVAIAGPTGIPWVNSNGWFCLLAHRLGKARALWLEFDPPTSSNLSHPANYPLAIADSLAYGSRWVISLDDSLKTGMIGKNPQAMRLWERMASVLSFFRAHEEWGGFQPQGMLAVISDFRGEHEFLSWEVLNLLSRRHVQYRIVERSGSLGRAFEGLNAILWVDGEAPAAELQSELLAFVRRGGLLITPSYWGPPEAKSIPGGVLDRYAVYDFGKGRIAVPKEGFQDPYEVAVDSHLLLSRRNDFVRLYNAPPAGCYCSADPRRKKALVQILDYSSPGPVESVSVWVRTSNRAGRLWNLGAKESVPIQGIPLVGGVEFHLPTFAAYAALEFENGNPRAGNAR